jgi:uncharacterized membrane protein
MNLQQIDWQTIVALTIVLAAIGVFARKTWRTLFRSSTSGCGANCHACPSTPAAGSVKLTQLIQLNSQSSDVD